MNTAGIFLIDIRLLSSLDYLAFLNHLLLEFSKKFSEAYLTIVLFDEKQEYIYNFEKSISIPHLELVTSTSKAAIFDTIGDALEKLDYLFPIYDINSVHCMIASLPKDNASNKYNVIQIRNLIQSKKNRGWHFYFPFSSFESLTKDIAF